MESMIRYGQDQFQQTGKSKNDIVIQNTNMPYVDNTQNQEENTARSQKINNSALYNDSQFVPFQNQVHQQSNSIGDNQYQPNFPQIQVENTDTQRDQKDNIIQQYEQVMQQMHQEIQKLLLINKDLVEKNQGNQRGNNFDYQGAQMQNLLKEKDDILETLKQRELAINALRVENEQLNNQVIELSSQKANSMQYDNQETQRFWKEQQFQERVKRLEGEIRDLEQQNFEIESMNKNLKRDIKHQSLVNDQLTQEMQELNQKRDTADQTIMDLKSQLSQQQIQQRQLNNVIQSQQIELTNIANDKQSQKKQEEMFEIENQKLKEYINEIEGQKLGQFQIIESKEREIQNLKAIVRKLNSVIYTHREAFGELADINYDQILKDVSNVNVNYTLPQATFQHLSKPMRQVKFDVNIVQPFTYQGIQDQNGNQENICYGKLDKLAQYVREENSQSSKRNSLENYQNLSQDNMKQRSILKNQEQKQIPQLQQENTNTVQWVTQNQPNISISDQVKQTQPNQKGRSPDKKPNVQGLRLTLSGLQEEKSSLENQLKNGVAHKSQEDVKFDLEVVNRNIKTIQDKINAASY